MKQDKHYFRAHGASHFLMSFKKHKGKANDQHRKHPQEKKKGKGKGEKGEFGTKNAVELR